MDEPTNGLDPTQILEIRKLIKELSHHSTVILSTHILQEVEALCDRAIIILQGKIAKDASLEDLKSSSRVHLEVEGNRETIKKLLSTSDNVTQVHFHSESKDEIQKFDLEIKNPKLTADIAKSLIENKLNLHCLQPLKGDTTIEIL